MQVDDLVRWIAFHLFQRLVDVIADLLKAFPCVAVAVRQRAAERYNVLHYGNW